MELKLVILYNIFVFLGLGKYRLAEGFEGHFISSTSWNHLDPEAKALKILRFFEDDKRKEVPFTKPLNAGKKCNKHKKRRKEEPELFAAKTNNLIPPVRLIKTKDWEVKAHEPDILNPDYDPSQSMTLVLRSDHANFPKKVKRCEACKIAFCSEVVVIKSTGERDFTKKTGKGCAM